MRFKILTTCALFAMLVQAAPEQEVEQNPECPYDSEEEETGNLLYDITDEWEYQNLNRDGLLMGNVL